MDFAEATEYLSFFDWKELFLETRGLDQPDGRQLFQYRVSDNEFGLLEDFLRSKIAALLGNNDFQYVCTRPGFADLFVMYGAEWWRRRYDGSGFSWEPILSDLEADSVEWHQYDRSECVRRGLAGWKLQILQTGGFKFLGAVAVQGGLPMRLLAEARGRVGHAISLVLRQAKTNSVSYQELQGWVESVQTILPKSYRQPVIFNLLADIAWTVLDLKQRAGLSSGQDAIAQLNRSIPDWRDKFPLPVDDNHARSLIEQLVREAATIKVQRQKITLPVERTLVRDDDETWQLRSSIDLPDTIDSIQLATLFNINEDDLPRTAELSLTVAGIVRETNIRKTAGHDKFRVSRQPWEISGDSAAQEHVFKLTAPDGRSWSCTAPRGSDLDESVPWVFSAEEGAMTLLRLGGGSVVESAVFVVTPSTWRITAQAGSEALLAGALVEQKCLIHRVNGTVSASDTAGNDFRIRSGNAAATRESFEWRGDRQWFGFVNPSIAFRGEPTLYSIDEDGNQRRLQGEIGCNVIGAPLSRLRFGPVFLRFPATGEIKQRTRMLLLPPEAKLGFEAIDPTSGSVLLKGWKASSARVVTPNVNSTYTSLADDLVLELEVVPEARTPDRVEIEVHWKHTTTPVHVSLPFPAKGVRGFKSDGKEIYSGERIAVQQLLGTRLVILGVAPSSQKLLRLRTSNRDIHRRYVLRSLQESMSTEIRLSDYRPEIEQLLTIDDNPDSTVHLVIELNGRETYSLEIIPHEASPLKDESRIHIRFSREQDLAEENDIQLLALRLESPGDEPSYLTEVECEDPDSRSWDTTPNLQEPGCWLLYPARDSKLTFRPTLWHVSGESADASGYANAVATPDASVRHAEFDSLIEAMASDFSHPNWIEVEQLAAQVGHLPLATIDLWRRFARSSRGMAALALRFGNLRTDFLYRFAQELPFSWETVAWEDWRSAACLSEGYCKDLFPEDSYRAVFDSFLKSRIDSFSAEFGSLFYVLGILSAAYFEDAKNDVARLKVGGLMAGGWLFQGENSLLMDLRRSRSGDNDEWPGGFKELVSKSRKDAAMARYLCPDHFGFQDSVINLPLVVASQLVINETADWFNDPTRIHALRTHRAFDPDWFDEAFNQTIARCLADGLLDH
jgi:hypothetical protein